MPGGLCAPAERHRGRVTKTARWRATSHGQNQARLQPSRVAETPGAQRGARLSCLCPCRGLDRRRRPVDRGHVAEPRKANLPQAAIERGRRDRADREDSKRRRIATPWVRAAEQARISVKLHELMQQNQWHRRDFPRAIAPRASKNFRAVVAPHHGCSKMPLTSRQICGALLAFIYVVAIAGTIIRSCRRVGPPARIWTTPAANPISVPICHAWS